jgi:uncharacterized protein
LTNKENAFNWFEIAMSDIKPSKKFYESVFDIHLEYQEMMGMQMAFLPSEDMNGKVTSSMVSREVNS